MTEAMVPTIQEAMIEAMVLAMALLAMQGTLTDRAMLNLTIQATNLNLITVEANTLAAAAMIKSQVFLQGVDCRDQTIASTSLNTIRMSLKSLISRALRSRTMMMTMATASPTLTMTTTNPRTRSHLTSNLLALSTATPTTVPFLKRRLWWKISSHTAMTRKSTRRQPLLIVSLRTEFPRTCARIFIKPRPSLTT